jgi:hypothetical protein
VEAEVTQVLQILRHQLSLVFFLHLLAPIKQNGFNGLARVNLAVSEINASGGILGRQVIEKE